jgi:hypothetical protein
MTCTILSMSLATQGSRPSTGSAGMMVRLVVPDATDTRPWRNQPDPSIRSYLASDTKADRPAP